MTSYAWGVLAHVLIGLAIVGGATALAWNGTINGEAVVGIYGTAVGLVGAGAVATVTGAATKSSNGTTPGAPPTP